MIWPRRRSGEVDPDDMEYVKEELGEVRGRVLSLEARVRAMEAAKRMQADTNDDPERRS